MNEIDANNMHDRAKPKDNLMKDQKRALKELSTMRDSAGVDVRG